MWNHVKINLLFFFDVLNFFALTLLIRHVDGDEFISIVIAIFLFVVLRDIVFQWLNLWERVLVIIALNKLKKSITVDV